MTDTTDTPAPCPAWLAVARGLAFLAALLVLGWLSYHAGVWVGEAAAAPALPSAPQVPGLDALIQPVF